MILPITPLPSLAGNIFIRSAPVRFSIAFEGAGAVINLAWSIQPSRDAAQLETVNVDGSRRVFDAVAEAGVPVLVHA